MPFHTEDTICAIATAPGGAARGMVRISGESAIDIASRLFEAANEKPIDLIRQPTSVSGRVRVEFAGAQRFVPCDLFLWPTNRSYTRQPVAELHTFGLRPLVEALLAAACRAGARLAEPGEFTLRAFLAGRLDLTQAEAVLGVIDARGAEEFDSALAQLAGGLARPMHQLRDELLQLLAELEAGLDFVDEDIEFISQHELIERLESAGSLLDGVAAQMASRHVARETPQIVLLGPPNVGKSSLFNAMVERFASSCTHEANHPALVSPTRGTTRDYLSSTISLNGIDCELIDTAGIDRSPATSIDATAQSFALERSKRATIRACCVEACDALVKNRRIDLPLDIGLTNFDIVVLTKADLVPPGDSIDRRWCGFPGVITSSHTGQGLAELSSALHLLLERDADAPQGLIVGATANRCRESIRSAQNSLTKAIELVRTQAGHELVAVDLRSALEELGRVVGAVYTDDLLDRIFATFCIGK